MKKKRLAIWVTFAVIVGLAAFVAIFGMPWIKSQVRHFLPATENAAASSFSDEENVSSDFDPITAREIEIKEMNPDGTTAESPYAAPAALGGSVKDAQMQIDGVVYQFPIPYQVMKANGWSLLVDQGSSYNVAEDSMVDPRNTSSLGRLSRGGETFFYVQVTNFSVARAAKASECAVTYLSLANPSLVKDPDLKVVTSGGVSRDMTLDQFLPMLSTPDFTSLNEDDIYKYSDKRNGEDYQDFGITFPYEEGAGGEGLAVNLSVTFEDGKMTLGSYVMQPIFSPYWTAYN